MKLRHGLELEEQVGALWHRLVGQPSSMTTYPEATVALEPMREVLAL
ncbi:MAG: hypothetical protein HQM05_13865, partial [Magnetococcales bacterium]|nr:hypothetical protein [Magnetococcales bacterium]